jgi:hypothetical protein
MTCLGDRAPCLPCRTWRISSFTIPRPGYWLISLAVYPASHVQSSDVWAFLTSDVSGLATKATGGLPLASAMKVWQRPSPGVRYCPTSNALCPGAGRRASRGAKEIRGSDGFFCGQNLFASQGGVYAESKDVLGPSEEPTGSLLVRRSHPTQRCNDDPEGPIPAGRSEFDRAFVEAGGGAQQASQIEPVSLGLVAVDFLRQSGGQEPACGTAICTRTSQGVVEESLREIARIGRDGG